MKGTTINEIIAMRKMKNLKQAEEFRKQTETQRKVKKSVDITTP